MKDFEFFKLEDRVLFEAAAAADIVAAADAAQNDPDANAGESERQAQQERNALKNLPPENPAAAMAHPGADDPSDIADVDAQIDALIQGEVGDVESDGRELVVINNSVLDKSAIIDSLKSNQDVLILKDGTGLDEVNAFLDQKGVEYSAIHFVTHGNEGYVSINGEIIDSGNFDAAASAAVWLSPVSIKESNPMLFNFLIASAASGRNEPPRAITPANVPSTAA